MVGSFARRSDDHDRILNADKSGPASHGLIKDDARFMDPMPPTLLLPDALTEDVLTEFDRPRMSNGPPGP